MGSRGRWIALTGAVVLLGAVAAAASRPASRRMARPARAILKRAETSESRRAAAELQVELQAVAIQGERERIARDMHDGLAQVLGYVNTKSQAVEELLAAGRVDEARRQLGELAAAARSVYVDVRESILNLSAPATAERGLAGALEEYGRHFAESAKLAVRFQATPEAVEAQLPAASQAEAFRIAREALTNVRKHARAGRVSIALGRDGPDVVLSIQDDGVGFEAEILKASPRSWPHFGLASMRERAESIGGRIDWHSRPGSGTEVELRVPVEEARPSPVGPGSR